MPIVRIPGKGDVQFPDNMTPYQIQLAIEREILPGRKPEAIVAPERPEGGVLTSLQGIGSEISALPSRARRMVEEIAGAAFKSPVEKAREAARVKEFGPIATRSRAQQEAAEQETETQLAAPEFDTMLGRGLYSGTSSLIQNLPGLVASVATLNPLPALANIAATTAPSAYQKYRERGGTVEEAALGSGAETGVELVTEKFPLGFAVKTLGKVGFGQFLRNYLGRELPSEAVATITQNAIDTAIANPDKSWNDYVNELPGALGETAIATLVPGTVLAGASKVAQTLQREPRATAEEAPPEGPGAEAGATSRRPSPPPPPPADMGALAKALGPVGGKVTLQEPSGPQEYTYQGLDEDGSVLLADVDGNVLAEDPAQISAAMKVGAVEPKDGLGAVAFGGDVTEGLPPVRAEAVAEETPPAPTETELTPERREQLAKEMMARLIVGGERAPTPAAATPAITSASAPEPFVYRPAPAPENIRTVTTPGGTKVDTAFEVVDAADLTAATGDLQNRDRSRAATNVQVQDIFSNFAPERLGESQESDRGSPIIGPDNVVESGNGRVMAINKVYDESPERAKAYRDFIESQGFGTTGMQRPVLVRRRVTDMAPEARSQFVRESTMDTKLRLSTSEQAGTDVAALTADIMGLMRSSDVNQAANRDFVRGFLSKLPPQEQAGFIDKDGALSAEGLRRLRTAIKASAYGDADLINTLDESQDNNIKSIGGALEDVAPNWRRLRDAVAEGEVRPEMDVTDRLVEAAKIVRDMRNRGEKVEDFLAQQDAFNPLNPLTERFIRSFYNEKTGRALGRDAITDVLDKYARRAAEQTTKDQLFAAEQLTPEQVLDGIAVPEEASLFGGGGSVNDMKKAVAELERPDDKVMNERANLQEQNRGCD